MHLLKKAVYATHVPLFLCYVTSWGTACRNRLNALNCWNFGTFTEPICKSFEYVLPQNHPGCYR